MDKTNEITNDRDRQLSFDDLRKKQSVRATFKLPQEIIDLLGIIAGQLGIKQKSLLDQLVEDTSMLGQLAREVGETTEVDTVRRQKTFVISRNSLHLLNDVAKKKNISRDVLVEFSIKRLLPLIETELERHNKRKVIFAEMKDHLRRSKTLYNRAKTILGEEDVLFDMLEKQLSLEQKNIVEADAVIEKGSPMEEW